MDRENWKVVNEIFHAALELPSGERGNFVCAASRGNLDLQSEVDRLLVADQQAGSFLDAPLLTENLFQDLPSATPLLKPGDVLKGRFRMVRLVGEGGMGQVFEAFDSELNVHVALKAIRAEIAANPTALEFFRREVRTARTITHPNVCRTFDLDRGFLASPATSPTEIFFLTMEFLEGESLSSRLKRKGALDATEALIIARQIAAALDAAHAAGIVHRDIKPANIMLVDDAEGKGGRTRAVVTDFGLARQDPANSTVNASSVSHNGIVGTLAYMAPEQLQPGSPISAATDVYAFGLLLFEMVTGSRAFPSANLLSGIAQRLQGPPPSPRDRIQHLPEIWDSVIQCCLRLEPGERFTSAGEVVEALQGHAAVLPLPSPATPQDPDIRRPFLSGRTFKLGAALLVCFVALFSVGFRLYRAKANAMVIPGALVYLAPVKNETDQRSLSDVTELLQAGLGQSAQINLLDQSRVGDTLQLMTKPPDAPIDAHTAREVAMRNGAVRVIFASVSGTHGNYHLNIDMQQPDNTPDRYREHWQKSFSWHTSATTTSVSSELSSTIRGASDWIRFEVGESQNDIARLDAPPQDVTTGNWQALSDFSRAQSLQRKELTADAIPVMRNAVAIDPAFSLAWARLGDLLAAAGRYRESFRAYESALDSGNAERLTKRERDRIKGTFALDSGDFEAAEAAFRDYSSYYENDYLGWFYRGYPLLMLGRTDAALETLRRAYSIDPSRGNAPWEIARTYISVGNLNEALVWANTLKGQGDLGNAAYIQGVVHFLRHQYPEALASFQQEQKQGRSQHHARAYSFIAMVEAEQGNSSAALKALDSGVQEESGRESPARSADKILASAFIKVNQGEIAAAVADLDRALAMDSSPQRVAQAASILGMAIANPKDRTSATLLQKLASLQNNLDKSDPTIVAQIAAEHVQGEIFLAHAEYSAAIHEFRKASQLDVRFNGQEALGRALEAASLHEHNPAQASVLRQQAADAYKAIATHPEYEWLCTNSNLPGIYRSQLSAYLRTAPGGHENPAAVRSAVCDYQTLTGSQARPFVWDATCGATRNHSM